MARATTSWLRIAVIVIVAVVIWWGKQTPDTPTGTRPGRDAPPIEGWRPGSWVEVSGRVQRSIRDDDRPPRHQRFILELPSGATLLVAHNIDLAPRVPLRVGDAIQVRGEYETNPKGGVIHWTHRDPGGRRPGGWVRHEGKQYR